MRQSTPADRGLPAIPTSPSARCQHPGMRVRRTKSTSCSAWCSSPGTLPTETPIPRWMTTEGTLPAPFPRLALLPARLLVSRPSVSSPSSGTYASGLKKRSERVAPRLRRPFPPLVRPRDVEVVVSGGASETTPSTGGHSVGRSTVVALRRTRTEGNVVGVGALMAAEGARRGNKVVRSRSWRGGSGWTWTPGRCMVRLVRWSCSCGSGEDDEDEGEGGILDRNLGDDVDGVEDFLAVLASDCTMHVLTVVVTFLCTQ